MISNIEKLEAERVKIYKQTTLLNKIANLLYIISLLSFIGIFLFKTPIIIILLLIVVVITFITGIILVHLSDKRKKVFKDPFKENLIEVLFKERYKDITYLPKGVVNMRFFLGSNLIRKPDFYVSDDFIKGKYNGTSFESSDVTLKSYSSRVNKNGQKVLIETFKGRLIILETKNYIETNIKVVEIRKDNYLSNPKTFETVEFESMEFNHKFQVDTDNKVEAFKFLTHKRIENILKIEKMFGGAISFTFSKNYIFIAIKSYLNHFEPKFGIPINLDPNNHYIKEVDMFKTIIDLLT